MFTLKCEYMDKISMPFSGLKMTCSIYFTPEIKVHHLLFTCAERVSPGYHMMAWQGKASRILSMFTYFRGLLSPEFIKLAKISTRTSRKILARNFINRNRNVNLYSTISEKLWTREKLTTRKSQTKDLANTFLRTSFSVIQILPWLYGRKVYLFLWHMMEQA